jgi:hypothetical protein
MRAQPIRYDRSMTDEATPLDDEHAALIQGGVSIFVAGRNAENETVVSRALGCRVSPDRRQVTLFLSATQSGALLADLRDNGVIAAVFGQPSTHRAIQLKGTDAAVAPVPADHAHVLAEYRRRLVAEVTRTGVADVFVQTLLAVAPGDVVAIVFTPSAAFLQTPGPKAGTPLELPK